MILTIIDTKDYGKFVLHKYPYQPFSLDREVQTRQMFSEILQDMTQYFQYFGIYKSHELIKTSQEPFSQTTVLDLFMANEKFSQVVMGVDDDCVLISRSVFFPTRMAQPAAESGNDGFTSENCLFESFDQEPESIINSMSIICRQDNFDNLEDVKHKLSFLLGFLQRNQHQNLFLTKNIHRMMEEKKIIKKKAKEISSSNIKDFNIEEVKIRFLLKQLNEQVEKIRQKNELFKVIKDFYESWGKKGQMLIVNQELISVYGSTFQIHNYDNQFVKEIENKTIVAMNRKLADQLPVSLYSERVKRIAQKFFFSNKHSFKKLLKTNPEISEKQLYHCVNFLLKNKLAIEIYPINYPYSYNLFTLKDIPERKAIEKGNKIFAGQNFLTLTSTFSKYKIVKQEDRYLKYLLSKQFIKEVNIYIYRKYQKPCFKDDRQIKPSSNIIEEILLKYNMTEFGLNYILSVEHITMNNLFNYIKNNSKYWGFYYLE